VAGPGGVAAELRRRAPLCRCQRRCDLLWRAALALSSVHIPPCAPVLQQVVIVSDSKRHPVVKIADVNPIHMAAWCAKLFGFRSNIAHGMLLMARFVQAAQATGMNLDGVLPASITQGPSPRTVYGVMASQAKLRN